jgi:heme/copper-type cytochrome/quinol oxidase subunit 2
MIIAQFFSYFWIGLARAQFTAGLPFGQGTYSNFGQYFTDLVTLAIEIAIAVATLIIVYAGILYGRSQGKAEQASQAKELIAGALTGLAILLLIRLILPTLNIGSPSLTP